MIDYDKILNKTAKIIKPSGIRKFFEIVNERKGAITLGVGEPDFDTPWVASAEAVQSIKDGKTHYTSNSGLLELRENICRYYAERMNVIYGVKNCLVTVGASEGIDLALRAVVNSGDEVLLPDPSYVAYEPCILLAGGVPVSLKCDAEHKFKLTPELLNNAVTDKTKAIILPYPNNPTGGIMERKYLEEIADIFIKNNIIVITDEIYAELTYNEAGHCSIASLPGMKERTVVINGFSKAFAMTGWRLGYILAPEELLTPMLRIHQYSIMCAPTMSQYAGLAALEASFADGFKEVSDMREEYKIRRNFVVNELNDMGLKCFMPEGAFYAFPSVKSLGMDGDEFAAKLLDEENVAVVPGSALGNSGKDYIRISYAYSLKNLSAALSKIRKFVENHKI